MTKLNTRIVAAISGFVFVGDYTQQDDGGVTLKNARNVRQWGTTQGLGELRTGPTLKTVVDACGTVHIPAHAVIFSLEVTGW